MTRFSSSFLPTLLVAFLIAVFTGCTQPIEAEKGPFAPGAFPPTMSNADYHGRAWTRTDCLVCHEKGVQEAPQMLHVSVPLLAKQAKCRTCHVVIEDESAESTLAARGPLDYALLGQRLSHHPPAP